MKVGMLDYSCIADISPGFGEFCIKKGEVSQFAGFATATGRIRCRHEIIPKGQAKFYLQLFTSIIYNSHLLVMLCTIIQFIYSITSESQFL